VFLINNQLKDLISQIKPAMVATAAKTGQPNVSPKGSLRVLDEQHLLFADLRSPITTNNLRENPYLSMIGFDPATRIGWRVWGKVVEITDSGDLYDRLRDEYAAKGKVNYAIKVLVEKGMVF
jgi:predicted pyridoxine 5'-phosphate oxidase superfamily flavin-nucleotide-binding protein